MSMERLKEYVDSGQVEIAKLNKKNQPQKVEFDQLSSSVSRQTKQAQIYRSVKDLDWDEKYEWVNVKKLRANQLYRNGNFDEAIELYMQSLVGLDLNDHTQNRFQTMQYDLQFPIMLNIATCLYKKKQYHKALEICDKILQQSCHLPALYKKAFILCEIGELDQSQKVFLEARKVQISEKGSQYSDSLKKLGQKIKESRNKNQEVYKKIFKHRDEFDEEESTELLTEKSNLQDEEQTLVPPPENFSEYFFELIRKCCSFGRWSARSKKNN